MDKSTEISLKAARGISGLILVIIAAIFIFDDVRVTTTTAIWVIGSCVVLFFTHTKLSENSNPQQTTYAENLQPGNNSENTIMFCRTCGKELPAHAVACIGCGMNPKEGNKYCPSCGETTKEKQIICTACGGSLEAENATGWSDGAYIGLLILSFFIPIFGWIFGGVKASKAPPNSKQKKQAWHYIYAGFGGLVLNIMIM